MNENVPEITPAQRRAFDAYNDCPVSVTRLLALFDYLAEHPSDDTAYSLRATYEFIRKRKLPKTKMTTWLSKYDISSDIELILKVAVPIAERFKIVDEWHRNKNVNAGRQSDETTAAA